MEQKEEEDDSLFIKLKISSSNSRIAKWCWGEVQMCWVLLISSTFWQPLTPLTNGNNTPINALRHAQLFDFFFHEKLDQFPEPFLCQRLGIHCNKCCHKSLHCFLLRIFIRQFLRSQQRNSAKGRKMSITGKSGQKSCIEWIRKMHNFGENCSWFWEKKRFFSKKTFVYVDSSTISWLNKKLKNIHENSVCLTVRTQHANVLKYTLHVTDLYNFLYRWILIHR